MRPPDFVFSFPVDAAVGALSSSRPLNAAALGGPPSPSELSVDARAIVRPTLPFQSRARLLRLRLMICHFLSLIYGFNHCAEQPGGRSDTITTDRLMFCKIEGSTPN
jgi:hypothetical protein